MSLTWEQRHEHLLHTKTCEHCERVLLDQQGCCPFHYRLPLTNSVNNASMQQITNNEIKTKTSFDIKSVINITIAILVGIGIWWLLIWGCVEGYKYVGVK